MDKLKLFLPEFLIEKIIEILIENNGEDVTHWVHSSNGEFTTKSASDLIHKK